MQKSGFFICTCPDSFLLQRHIQILLDERFANEPIDRHIIWADEGLSSRFWDLLSLQGFTAKPRVLVVRHLEAVDAETLKKLSAALAQVRAFVWVILCLECAWAKGQPKVPAHLSKLPFYAFAEKQAWMWRAPPLTVQSMPNFVRKEAKTYGLTLTDAMLVSFCDAVNPDGAAINMELTKLALLNSQGLLNEKCFELMTKQVQFDVFPFLRALQMKQTDTIWKTIVSLQNIGEGPLFLLLVLLQREARLFWQILSHESPYLHPSEKESKQQLARSLGTNGVIRFFDALHTAEYSVKSGFLNTNQALEKLLGEITQIFS